MGSDHGSWHCQLRWGMDQLVAGYKVGKGGMRCRDSRQILVNVSSFLI